MVHLPRAWFSFEEYAELVQTSSVKHEFLNGQVWAMAGGSPDHARIAMNVSRIVANALQGRPCSAFSSDLRVRVKATGLATYPDVSVVCGELELDPEDRKAHTVTNPTVLVEVLSPSTQNYDRGEKLGHYQLIESLREILLIAHDRREVEIVRREDDGTWSRHIARDGERARLASIDCELPVAEIYRNPLTR